MHTSDFVGGVVVSDDDVAGLYVEPLLCDCGGHENLVLPFLEPFQDLLLFTGCDA